MKNRFKKRVLEICDTVNSHDYLTIIDHLVDCTIRCNIDKGEPVTADDIDYILFECHLIMECIDRTYVRDINLLTALIIALEEWESDFEFINNTLGLPPES